VAIKRVLPHLAQNEAFIQMFLDEARLSARLDHANIVSVFDISQQKDTYFLVMEYVEGANLKKIIEALRKRGQRIDLGAATLICIEACRGLSYAHELPGEDGKPLHIVHRDISPPNILLTRRGEVKLADFGLAKASTQIQTTDPGVVKGKFSYLSPEAANGKDVDARADIFSVGIVLWEMLAGRRLFLGETDYATVKLIQGANIPRLAPLNNQVDEAFEEILLKALTRDPDDRYQSAREFGDALTGYLFSRQLKVTNYDLANLVNAAMSDDAMPTKNESSLIDRLIQEELDESVGMRSAAHAMPETLGSQGEGGIGLGDLEDPASWFRNDSLPPPAAKAGAAAPEAPATPAEAERSSGSAPRAAAGWRESGVEHMPVPRTSTPSTEDVQELRTSELMSVPPDLASAATSAAATAPPAKKGGAGKYVIVAAVLAVAAVAFVLLGQGK
jgi:serine/threonine-protein kinase